MFKPLKTILVAGGLALGLSGFAATNAHAGQTSLTIGGPGYSLTLGNGGVRPVRDLRRGRVVGRQGVCNPRRALRKASRRGLNRPHVQRVNGNRIVVAGWSRGERIVMGMGRHRSCPVHFVRARGDRRIGGIDRFDRVERRNRIGGAYYSNR